MLKHVDEIRHLNKELQLNYLVGIQNIFRWGLNIFTCIIKLHYTYAMTF